ncbi:MULTISPECIES: hypothetical protein [Enterobacteriaceae]|uniref:HTH luxR-type domain-containing protein n=1 Tax=Enterobacter quasiroggenkampii TaxID=2497436 RepID=A0ABY8DY96_9ENTR|nr:MULTISPECIES: hypothetical protein [Enterobacteriaceae]WFC81904.1 hypothetical protein OM418_18095 [Enterobacter quasiroggenkampii]WFC86149.1 hypothetical protein OM419_17480 [Enterobacter roggenkampii]
MKIIIISDNQFYLHAFTNVDCSMTVTSDLALDINHEAYDNAIVIISETDNTTMLDILGSVIKINAVAVFIEPMQWPKKTKLTNIYNIYILPPKMNFNHLMDTIEKSMLPQSNSVSVNPEKIRASEWSTMLHLMTGISNRNLAHMFKSSEKTISGRIISLSIKTGLAGLNRGTQLNAMYLFYMIYTLTKPMEKRKYYKKQYEYILESVKTWASYLN